MQKKLLNILENFTFNLTLIKHMRPMHTNLTCIFSRSENITDNGFVIELYSDVNVQNSNSKNGKITIKARSGQSL